MHTRILYIRQEERETGTRGYDISDKKRGRLEQVEESSYAHEDMIYPTRREGDWNKRI